MTIPIRVCRCSFRGGFPQLSLCEFPYQLERLGLGLDAPGRHHISVSYVPALFNMFDFERLDSVFGRIERQTALQHGREIDSQSSDYSEPALRALKRFREDMARRELQNSTTRTDGSAILIELPYADTADKLVEIIAPHEYTFETTSSVRTIVQATSRGKRLLELVPEVIIGTWDIHPNVAGILATLLSASLAT